MPPRSTGRPANGTNPVPNGGTREGPGTIYLRVNAGAAPSKITAGKCTDPAKACTYPVSELVSEKPALFIGAATDGSRAIFLSEGELYEYDASAKAVNLIAKGVSGVLGTSADASKVYLVSSEVLSTGKNSHGDEAQAGKPNLYLHQASGFTFVGTLAAVDGFNETEPGAPLSPSAKKPRKRSSRVTPDGNQVAFTSGAPLTGFDNTDAVSGQPDLEVFLFDASRGELICASCNPSGAAPTGQRIGTGQSTAPIWAAAKIPGWTDQLRPTRALSEDGQRLFFESYEALVPRDTNSVQDVYEWERSTSRADAKTPSAANSSSNPQAAASA